MRKSEWHVVLSGQAKKADKNLSSKAHDAFMLLLAELRFGPEAPSWPNYSKLGKGYHCHLKKGRPTYVACWMADKTVKKIEVYYAGTHEKAPY